jgi:histidine triad (HIT) family protein
MMTEKACVFCAISAHVSPAEFVYEDDTVIVIRDRFPKAPVHILAIPRKHIASLQELTGEDAVLLAHLVEVIQLVTKQLGVDNGYRVIINIGEDGGQTVTHLHVHVIAGRCLGFR